MQNISSRLAVCSWSLQPKTPAELAEKLRRVGINKVQLALDPVRVEPKLWGDVGKILATNGIEIVSGMFGCVGEDYSTLESIRRTGGVVPDVTWAATWANVQKNALVASHLGLTLVSFHAGFLPHDPHDPVFQKARARITQIANLFGERGVELAFETGQEDAGSLKQFLDALARPNVGVNFDPANMLLYGSGEPVHALRLLRSHVKQCHIKDAKRSTVKGQWGKEVVVGEGEVEWLGFFRALDEIKFAGHLVIEREGGNERAADVIHARDLVLSLESKL